MFLIKCTLYRLPLLMVLWGSMACLHAAVKNYAQLMTLRFFLGFFEAGFFPGVVFFLTQFYKKNEMVSLSELDSQCLS